MALVDQGYEVSVMLQDLQGDTITKTYELQAATEALALTAIGTILTALDINSNCAILGYNLLRKTRESAPAFGTGDGSVKARLSARKTNGEVASVDIPAPVESIFTAASGPGNNIVDMTNVNIIAYLDLFESGNQAFISDGEFLADASGIDGQRVTVRKRKVRR
jgi:hypothetical protein